MTDDATIPRRLSVHDLRATVLCIFALVCLALAAWVPMPWSAGPATASISALSQRPAQ